jgi:uncharacterized delta-60 repeat protein
MKTLSPEQLLQPGDVDISFANLGHLEPSSYHGRTYTIVCSESGALTHASEINGRFFIERHLVNGDKDPQFNPMTWVFESGDESTPNRLLLQPDPNAPQADPKIVLIGESFKDGVVRPAITRLLPNGSPDLIFGRRILPQPEDSQAGMNLRRQMSDGCLQSDGKILVAAVYVIANTYQQVTRLYRLEINGELDLGFGQGKGFIEICFREKPSWACAVQMQSSGKIIVAGGTTDDKKEITLARYTPQGDLDDTFGTDGFAHVDISNYAEETGRVISGHQKTRTLQRLVVQSDDKLVFVGHTANEEQGVLMRLKADGSVDPQFNDGVPVFTDPESLTLGWSTVAIQPDGKIVAAGRGFAKEKEPDGTRRVMRVKQRFLANGTPDTPFNTSMEIGDFADIAIQQKTGRILLSGSEGLSWAHPRTARITAFLSE